MNKLPCFLLLILCGCASTNLSNIPFEPSIEYTNFKRSFTVAYIVPNELIGKIYRIDSGAYKGNIEIGNKFVLSIYNLLTNKFLYVIPIAEDDKNKMLRSNKYDLIVLPILEKTKFEAPITGIGQFDFTCTIGITLFDQNESKIKDLIVNKSKPSASIAMSGSRNIYQLAYNSVNGTFELSLKALEKLLDNYINTNMVTK